MEVQLGDLTKKEANLSILGGDIATIYIIQDELLKSSSIQFAGVIAKHPLTNTLHMRVVSNNPLKDIIKATNTVIEGATEISVMVNDSISYAGTLLGADVFHDIAVLKICCDKFQPLEIKEGIEVLEGDRAVAMGYPLGISGRASKSSCPR